MPIPAVSTPRCNGDNFELLLHSLHCLHCNLRMELSALRGSMDVPLTPRLPEYKNPGEYEFNMVSLGSPRSAHADQPVSPRMGYDPEFFETDMTDLEAEEDRVVNYGHKALEDRCSLDSNTNSAPFHSSTNSPSWRPGGFATTLSKNASSDETNPCYSSAPGASSHASSAVLVGAGETSIVRGGLSLPESNRKTLTIEENRVSMASKHATNIGSTSTKVRHHSQSRGSFSSFADATERFSDRYHKSSVNFRVMENLAKVVEKHSAYKRNPKSVLHLIWRFLENPASSRWAYFYGSYFSPLLLLAGVLTSFIQTVEDHALPDRVFDIIQITFEIWFALEIAIRFLVSPDKVGFWLSFYNVIDFLSATPLLFRVFGEWLSSSNSESDVSQFIVGVVPMLRLMKVLRRFHKFQLLVSAFGMALEALPVLIFALLLIAIFFSGLMYVVEPRTLIDSLPISLWYVVVTMTTVGYGDIVPVTFTGKFISSLLMITSALYMAMPIGIVGTAFSDVWRDRDRLLLIAVLRESFAISGVSRELVHEIFIEMLEDDSQQCSAEPEIGVAEFLKMMHALQIDISNDRLVMLFSALDVDANGTVSCDEFLQTLFPKLFIKPPTVRIAAEAVAERIQQASSNIKMKASKSFQALSELTDRQ